MYCTIKRSSASLLVRVAALTAVAFLPEAALSQSAPTSRPSWSSSRPRPSRQYGRRSRRGKGGIPQQFGLLLTGPSPQQASALLAVYGRSQGNQRYVLQRWLTQLGKLDASLFITAIGSEDDGVRTMAAELLGAIGDRRAVGPLLKALFDERHVAVAAAGALDKINPKWRDLPAARQMVPALIAAVESGQVDEPLGGGWLAELKRRAAEPSHHISNFPNDVRREMGGSVGRDAPTRRARELLKDPETAAKHWRWLKVCAAASNALAQLRDRRAADALPGALLRLHQAPEALPNSTLWAVVASARALQTVNPQWGQTEAGRAVSDAYLRMLKAEKEHVRRTAVAALGILRDRRATGALAALLGRRSRGRRYAGRGVVNWRPDPDTPTRPGEALVRIGDKRVLPELLKLAGEWNAGAMSAAALLGEADAVAPLAAMLAAEKDERKRFVVFSALCLIEAPEVKARLLEGLADDSPRVRIAAVTALARGGGADVIEGLIKATADPAKSVRRAAVRAVGELGGEGAVDALIASVHDESVRVRLVAAQALGKIGGNKAVDPLVAPILYAIPAQLLAYHTAVAKGTDVDQPRNLAKSVTVE
ncbi:hypothetical protein LCGC14_1625000 [marine sediment metagenome]|uniref:HEAT repeat domain-containing protein n=1 Tax=marine sediment metagenome TaxID=412755 RepID=A0A0F9IRB4_9ZZZZ